ncbi:unnamed protein product [Haemonchus placei]|uniref:PMD domain-containing protein n=1 Tax=Haemonchus placei TaxID=6290 RepID=A0A0N4WYB9_HAEPC|nr:unnamed protein product [Haemonchus placei]
MDFVSYPKLAITWNFIPCRAAFRDSAELLLHRPSAPEPTESSIPLRSNQGNERIWLPLGTYFEACQNFKAWRGRRLNAAPIFQRFRCRAIRTGIRFQADNILNDVGPFLVYRILRLERTFVEPIVKPVVYQQPTVEPFVYQDLDMFGTARTGRRYWNSCVSSDPIRDQRLTPSLSTSAHFWSTQVPKVQQSSSHLWAIRSGIRGRLGFLQGICRPFVVHLASYFLEWHAIHIR